METTSIDSSYKKFSYKEQRNGVIMGAVVDLRKKKI